MINKAYLIISYIKKLLNDNRKLKILFVTAAVLILTCALILCISGCRKNNEDSVMTVETFDYETEKISASTGVIQIYSYVETYVTTTSVFVSSCTDSEKKAETTATVSVTTQTTAVETEAKQTETKATPVYTDTEFKSEYLTEISPNYDFYNSRIAVLGDSVAYGFNGYGYIPWERNYAKESVSMWNFDYFTIPTEAGDMSLTDAVALRKPSLLYMSVGINDLPAKSPEAFIEVYKRKTEYIIENCPGIVIVVAGITPVTEYCTYTDNETVRSYNKALKEMVHSLNNPNVYYFDAYYVLADPITLANPSVNSADGIHIAKQCYQTILNALYNYLDDTFAVQQIIRNEQN